MARLPDNVNISIHTAHEISNCHWDEESQLYRVIVDGIEYQSRHTLDGMKTTLEQRRRSVAAFEAMARCAEARENRQKVEDEIRDSIRAEVLKEAGYNRTDAVGYRSLGIINPQAKRLVDMAVEARLNLERQGQA